MQKTTVKGYEVEIREGCLRREVPSCYAREASVTNDLVGMGVAACFAARAYVIDEETITRALTGRSQIAGVLLSRVITSVLAYLSSVCTRMRAP